MSSSCWDCGSPLPDGQGVCSMCYGDVEYGNDGYYKEWLELDDGGWAGPGSRACEKCGEKHPNHADFFAVKDELVICEKCFKRSE